VDEAALNLFKFRERIRFLPSSPLISVGACLFSGQLRETPWPAGVFFCDCERLLPIVRTLVGSVHNVNHFEPATTNNSPAENRGAASHSIKIVPGFAAKPLWHNIRLGPSGPNS